MSDQVDRGVLPIRRPPFAGVADKTLGGSRPDWGLIGHVKHPAGAPNVLLVLIDDADFSFGRGATQLKAALADAQAGMGG
jgi:arylsulfatase